MHVKKNLGAYLNIANSGLHDNGLNHQDNMSVCFIPPYTPLLYNITGVYMGIHYLLIFALNEAVLTCTHNICLSKNMKIVGLKKSTQNCHF